MRLNYKEFGQGKPLIILHGLLGSLDNWQSLARRFGEEFHVFTVDQRNHGQSPQSDDMDYHLLSDDLHQFILEHHIERPVILGHSMGGKTAMAYAFMHPEEVEGLIVVDISPKHYDVHHGPILDALASVDFQTMKDRKTIQDHLMSKIGNMGIVLFLSKNIYWKTSDELAFRFNLSALRKHIATISSWPFDKEIYKRRTLFVRGGSSNYIAEDEPSITRQFPNAGLVTVEGAGHWVHAEKPEELYQIVRNFMSV